MRKLSISAAGALCALLAIGLSSPLDAADHMRLVDDDETPGFPGGSGLQLPPGLHPFPTVPGTRKPSANPGVNSPLVPPLANAPESAKEPAKTRAEILDGLFQRLAVSSDPEEASGVAQNIQRLWLQSGSDTADLLMSRVASVMASGKTDVAAQLLDKLVSLDPDWVEAWNKRATMRFLNDDDFGSMEDIMHVLTLEPRHFGALSGMAMILQRHGMKRDALVTLRRAAVIYPHNADLEKMINVLTPEVEGREL